MTCPRHGVYVRLEDQCAVTKRVNESVDFLAQRLADSHSLYGKNDHKGISLDIWDMRLVRVS